ncbi:MAG: hypothetical protein DMG57_12565 [Acidobacteria bacterium]|nr:MAG: hypothetical protein DMG57_12565 [Acidobacteriota bacterium]
MFYPSIMIEGWKNVKGNSVPAAEDLEGIKDYLNQHYPHFAEPTVRTIYQRIRSLKTAPNRGRPGHRSGTRELPLSLTSWSIP